MLTPEFDVIISTLSELSGKSIAERDAMVAGGNALIEALISGTAPDVEEEGGIYEEE